jgi:putative peptide zinc metalloprotease protein
MSFPKLRPDIFFYETNETDVLYVYSSSLERHYKIGKTEAQWLKLCDGRTSIKELRDKLANECPAELLEKFLDTAKRMALFEDCATIEKKRFNILQVKWKLCNLEIILVKIPGVVNFWAFFLKIFSLPIFAVGLFFLWNDFKTIFSSVSEVVIGPGIIPLYIIAFFLFGALHEISHAMVAKSYGTPIPATGLMLYYFNIALYVDLSGIALLKSTRQKVASFLAGIMSQLIISSIMIILFHFFGEPNSMMWSYFLIFAMGNFLSALFNLIPFVKLDGYFILSSLLGIPKLREISAKYFLERLSGKSKDNLEISFGTKGLFIVFAIMSGLFTPVMIAGGLQFFSGVFLSNYSDIYISYLVSALSLFFILQPLFMIIYKKASTKKFQLGSDNDKPVWYSGTNDGLNGWSKKNFSAVYRYWIACCMFPLVVFIVNNYLSTKEVGLSLAITVLGFLTATGFIIPIRAQHRVDIARFSFLGGALYGVFTFISGILGLIINSNNLQKLATTGNVGNSAMTFNNLIQKICFAVSGVCLFVALFIMISIIIGSLIHYLQQRGQFKVKLNNIAPV